MSKSVWLRRDIPAIFTNFPKAVAEEYKWDFAISGSESDFLTYISR